MLLTRTRKKVLGTVLTTGLYAWVMGTAYVTDQNIQDSFIRSSMVTDVEGSREGAIFDAPVITVNPFVQIFVRKDEKSISPERVLPSIPSINYPRPNIPVITARPVALHKRPCSSQLEIHQSRMKEHTIGDIPIRLPSSSQGTKVQCHPMESLTTAVRAAICPQILKV